VIIVAKNGVKYKWKKQKFSVNDPDSLPRWSQIARRYYYKEGAPVSTAYQTAWSGRHPGKDEIRARIWSLLVESGAAIGDPVGHIPNFAGAEQAAERLAQLPVWKRARVIKSNPDSPQIPVRLTALQEGKIVYMAVPRLAQEKCFIELAPDELNRRQVPLSEAARWQGALQYGRAVAFEEMQPIDLAVAGCVAVTREGGRTGKGAGFADIEFGLLRQYHLIQPGTPIVTTVHPLMIVPAEVLPTQPHDTYLNWIVTPDEVIEVRGSRPQPFGIDWDKIQPDQYATIPVLRKLRGQV
jgi:5-formyltetrahydrofolate cyclo-ligase